jgi:hypothetical protein
MDDAFRDYIARRSISWPIIAVAIRLLIWEIDNLEVPPALSQMQSTVPSRRLLSKKHTLNRQRQP